MCRSLQAPLRGRLRRSSCWDRAPAARGEGMGVGVAPRRGSTCRRPAGCSRATGSTRTRRTRWCCPCAWTHPRTRSASRGSPAQCHAAVSTRSRGDFDSTACEMLARAPAANLEHNPSQGGVVVEVGWRACVGEYSLWKSTSGRYSGVSCAVRISRSSVIRLAAVCAPACTHRQPAPLHNP